MSNPVDQILTFTPVFVTPSGEIARVHEEDLVNLYIDVVETGTMSGYIGQTSVWVGNAVTLVESVSVEGVSIPFQRQLDNQRVFWDLPYALTREAPVVVTLANPSGNYALLNGALPPGLSITDKGLVTGRVTNITAPPAAYAFTVRYKNEAHTHDRRFTIYAEGKDYPAFFNPDQLKPLVTEPQYGFQYKFLGTLGRGQGYAYTLDIFDPDGVLPGFTLQKVTGFLPNSGKFGGLPPDLAIVGQTVQGVVAPDACPGQYFFKINLKDSGQDGAIFMIEVKAAVTDIVGVIPQVIWDTPAGSLGEIEETEPCYFAVQAHSINAPPITYSLAPYSAPLPAGITLNVTTGRFYGVMPYVSSDTVFTFRLRATAGDVFADRIFAMTVRDWFDLDTIHQLRLQTRISDELKLVPVYAETVPYDLLYRPEDPSFGFVRKPYVYLIKGLDGSKDIEPALRGENQPVVPGTNTDYHARFSMILGDHRFASARNSKGEVVYEVLYRELYDPMARAGGFSVVANVPVQTLVRWPQSGPVSEYIFPVAVKNMRYDLIVDVGLAMNDPTERHLVGPQTNELMPLWMRSEQIQGVADSVPGYQTALVLAYLKPGSAAAVAKAINTTIEIGSMLTKSGHVYHFDKYYTTETAVVYQTTLDDQREDPQTILDSTDTIFDEVDGDVVKYLD